MACEWFVPPSLLRLHGRVVRHTCLGTHTPRSILPGDSYAAALQHWYKYIPKVQSHAAAAASRCRAMTRCMCCDLCVAQENILVVFAEELREDRQRVVDTITRFLGLPPFDVSAYTHAKLKDM